MALIQVLTNMPISIIITLAGEIPRSLQSKQSPSVHRHAWNLKQKPLVALLPTRLNLNLKSNIMLATGYLTSFFCTPRCSCKQSLGSQVARDKEQSFLRFSPQPAQCAAVGKVRFSQWRQQLKQEQMDQKIKVSCLIMGYQFIVYHSRKNFHVI